MNKGQEYWRERARIGLKKGWLTVERKQYQTTDLGSIVAGAWLRHALQCPPSWHAVEKACDILCLRGVPVDLECNADDSVFSTGNWGEWLYNVPQSLTTDERIQLGLPTGLLNRDYPLAVIRGLALQPEAKPQLYKLLRSESAKRSNQRKRIAQAREQEANSRLRLKITCPGCEVEGHCVRFGTRWNKSGRGRRKARCLNCGRTFSTGEVITRVSTSEKTKGWDRAHIIEKPDKVERTKKRR